MIRWCSYCSIYLGECPPYDDYSLTHGVCPVCAKAGYLDEGSLLPEKTIRLCEFYSQLRKKVMTREVKPYREILDEALALEIKPIDLLFGMIQPSLYEVGQRWASSSLTVADEHWFTSVCSGVIDQAWEFFPEGLQFRHSESPVVLLVNADGNEHSLGVRLIEILLSVEKIPNYMIYPGLPSLDVFQLAQKLKPKIIGISISQRRQMEAVFQLCSLLENLPQKERPQLALGGFPIREGLTLDSKFHLDVFVDVKDFLKKVKASH